MEALLNDDDKKNLKRKYNLTFRLKNPELMKKYYNEHNEKYKQRITCECKASYLYSKKNQHFRTKKHIKALSTIISV